MNDGFNLLVIGDLSDGLYGVRVVIERGMIEAPENILTGLVGGLILGPRWRGIQFAKRNGTAVNIICRTVGPERWACPPLDARSPVF